MTDKSKFGMADQLDQLFNTARAIEPVYEGDNFSKTVLNQLPAQPDRLRSIEVSESRKRGIIHDLFGFFVGMITAFLIFDPTKIDLSILDPSRFNPAHFVAALNSLMPNNIVISLSNIIIISLLLISSALVAWWVVESSESV